jgi:hypothetical protein
MEDIMDILQIRKGLFLEVLKQFHIYANSKSDMHLTTPKVIRDNPVRDALPAHTSQQGNTSVCAPIQFSLGASSSTTKHQITHVSHFA